MGTNCAPLVADLLLVCIDLDSMLSLSDYNKADVINHILMTYSISTIFF